MENNAKVANNEDDAEDDDEPEHQPMEVKSDESKVFSYVEAVEFLGRLQQLCAPKHGVNEVATVHLDCFLKVRHSGNARKLDGIAPIKVTSILALSGTLANI